jgi:hypothetical protein
MIGMRKRGIEGMYTVDVDFPWISVDFLRILILAVAELFVGVLLGRGSPVPIIGRIEVLQL